MCRALQILAVIAVVAGLVVYCREHCCNDKEACL